MWTSPIYILLLLGVICVAQGEPEQQESRLYRRLDSFCDDVEDFQEVLAKKKASFEKHAVYLRLLATKVDKVHTEATKKVVWSGVAVGGDVINIAGLVLDCLEKGNPYISTVGAGISTLGSFFQEMACASEQEQWDTKENNVGNIFEEIEEDLREITEMHSEIQEKLRELEKEEGLLGTPLHKKLMEIKIKLSHFKPLKINQNYVHMTLQLFDMLLKLPPITRTIESVVDTVAGKVSTGVKISTSDGVSEKYLEGAPGMSQVVLKKNHFTYFKNTFRAVTAAASLYRDGEKLYKGILHLNKGAGSDLAKNFCEVASYLESVTEKLDRFLPKRRTLVQDA